MTKSIYWLTGPEDTFVQVEGAAQRDSLADDGWTEATSPTGQDRVWLRHSITRAFAKFPAEALDGWHALGWEFETPPTRRADLGFEVVLPGPEPEPTTATVAQTATVAVEPQTDEAEQPPTDNSTKSVTAKEKRNA